MIHALDILAKAACDPKLNPAALRVLTVIAKHADNETGLCWPSQNRMANAIGISRQAVSRQIAALQQAGYLEITYRQDPYSGAHTVNLYRLTSPQHDVAPLQQGVAPPATSGSCSPPQQGVAPINSSNNNSQKDSKQADNPPRKKPAAPKKWTLKTLPEYSEDFETFLATYPANDGPKNSAFLHWLNLIEAGTATADHLLFAAGQYAAEIERKRTGQQYTAYASNWLRELKFQNYERAPEQAPAVWTEALDLARANRDSSAERRILDALHNDPDRANEIGREYIESARERMPREAAQ